MTPHGCCECNPEATLCVLGRPLALLQTKPQLLFGLECRVAEEDRRYRYVGHWTQLGNEYGVVLNAVLSCRVVM